MTSESADLLAKALEYDADAQERGDIENLAMRFDDVYGEILPINEIHPALFALALRFWDDWGDASRHDWQYHKPFRKDDWPRIARIVAAHLRLGTMPEDSLILEHFAPRPKVSLFKWGARLFSRIR